MLYREFDRYGVIDKITYPENSGYAFITFDSIQNASDAFKAMRNFPLGGRDRKLRVDFAAPCVERRQWESYECKLD